MRFLSYVTSKSSPGLCAISGNVVSKLDPTGYFINKRHLTVGMLLKVGRHLTVGNSLLGQIVVDDESVLAVVTEELAHGAARVGRQVL